MRPSADGKRTALLLGIITSVLIMTGVAGTAGSASAAKSVPVQTSDQEDVADNATMLLRGIRW